MALFALIADVRCRAPYVLPSTSSNLNLLVVEGVVNTGSDSTIIHVTRTQKLTDTVNLVPETGAALTIIDPSGGTFASLTEIKSGYYYMPGLNNPALQSIYKLKIVTGTGKTYMSDVLTVKNSPPIDSVNFEIGSNGLELYSATHDATNNSRYYRWDYKENWKIEAGFQSNLEAQTNPHDTIIIRQPKDEIYVCFQNDTSSSIIINTSATLSQDVIAHNPVAFVASSSEKLSHEYCITVNQYVLTKDAFNYWQNIKKNTEQLGSIFDAQPSEIQGNIHSVSNPGEPVIGFITMGTSAQKRLFIGNSQVPKFWYEEIASPYVGCKIDTFLFIDPRHGNSNTTLELYKGYEIPLYAYLTYGYYAARSYCADCRFRGTTTPPSFWIDKF